MILTVDDDNEVNYVLYKICKDLNIPTVSALNYEYAAQILASADINLVLCDMVFGGNEHGGIDFIKLLRERGLKTPVVIISGNPDPRLHELAKSHGAIEFIEKPICKSKIQQLYNTVCSRTK